MMIEIGSFDNCLDEEFSSSYKTKNKIEGQQS